ncbi:MAG: hypothetical protein ACYSTT_10190 [Planctomycetota bacterium]
MKYCSSHSARTEQINYELLFGSGVLLINLKLTIEAYLSGEAGFACSCHTPS